MTDEISNLTQVIRDHSECELDYGTLKTLTMIDAESKLRDAEIEELKEIIANTEQYQAGYKSGRGSQQAEIETFKIISSKQYDKIENLEAEIKSYEQSETIMTESYVKQQAEIKKLREALNDIKYSTGGSDCMYEIAEEALEDGK